MMGKIPDLLFLKSKKAIFGRKKIFLGGISGELASLMDVINNSVNSFHYLVSALFAKNDFKV